MTGRGVAPVRAAEASRQERLEVTEAGEVQVTIKAKGKQRKKLKKAGKVTVTANVTFTATGGEPNTETKKVKLVRKK